VNLSSSTVALLSTNEIDIWRVKMLLKASRHNARTPIGATRCCQSYRDNRFRVYKVYIRPRRTSTCLFSFQSSRYK